MASVRAEPATPRRATIRAELLRLVLVVILPLIALGAWDLYDDYQSDSRQAREQVSHVAQITASETARFLGETQRRLNALAARPAMRALDGARCDPILKQLLEFEPRYANVATLDMDARIICSAAPLAGPTRGNPERFIRLLRGPDQLTVGKAAAGVITGRWIVPLGRPLLDARGAVAGAVVLPVDLLTLPVLPSLQGLPANAIVGLIEGDGTVLARSLDAQRFVGTKAGAGRTAQRQKSGTAEVMGLDGTARIQGFVPVPGTDWIAIASVPASAVYAGVNARIAASALIAIAVLATALLLALQLSRRIHGPITALAGAADEVAAGNLAARAPITGAAEVAHVAGQFNAMLDARGRAESELREGEARYRSLVESASDAILVSDLQGRLQDANAAACRMFGYTREELLTMRAADLVVDAETARVAPEMARLTTGAVLASDWQCRRKDGAAFPVESSATVVPDRRVLAILRDVTQRKQSEQAMHERETELREAQRVAKLAHAVALPDGSFESWSETLPALAGMDAARMPKSAREWLTIAHPDDRAMFREKTIEAAKTGQPFEFDYRLRRSDGAWIDIHHAAEPVLPATGSAGQPRWLCTLQDVTEIKRAARALRASELRHRDLIEAMDEGFCVIEMIEDPNGKALDYRFVEINPAFMRQTGLSGALTKTMREMVPDHDEHWFEIYGKVARTGEAVRFENPAAAMGRYYDVFAFRLGGDGSRRVGILFNDITERKRDATLLAGQRRTLELIASGAPLKESLEALVRVLEGIIPNTLGSILLLDDAGLHLRHGAAPGLPQDYIRAIDGVAIGPRVGSCGTAAYRGEQVVVDDIATDPLWADFRDLALLHGLRACWSTPIFDAGQHVLGTFAMYYRAPRFPTENELRLVEALTHTAAVAIEKARAAAALSDASTRSRELSRRLLDAQETERRAIARELHDEVGGVLTAVKLNLQSLRGKPAGRAGGVRRAGDAALADGLALVDGAIQSVRSLSLDLHPAVLDDLGLIPALKWYCGRTAQRAGIPIELALDAIDLKSAPQLESGCFRIVQEAVSNALRHAGASSIQVALRLRDDRLVLEVADDGGGFDVAMARQRALAGESSGLLGMEERAKLLGGQFNIDAAPGVGTCVRVVFAVPEDGFG